MMEEKISCVILAGGQSLRMGQAKAFVSWRGKRLIEWVYEVVSLASDQIIISANSGDFSFLSAEVVADRFPGCGPLAGIEAGLSRCKNDPVLVVSCDMPGIRPELIRWLLSQSSGFEVTVPVHEGRMEPLIGIYSRSLLTKITEALKQEQYTPHRFIRTCSWQGIEISENQNFYHPDLFMNLNSMDDLTR